MSRRASTHAQGAPMSESEQPTTTPAPHAPARTKGLPTWLMTTLTTGFMPVFFMVLLTLTFVSSQHSPRPHDMALTVAGPQTVTAQIADTLTEHTGGSLAVTTTSDADSAREQVRDREAAGAIIVEGMSVTGVDASAGGSQAAAVVRQVGTEVATGLGTTVTVEDVAPLAAGDTSGTMLFFLLVPCTVGAFLAVFGPAQVRTSVRMRELLTSNVVAALVAPSVILSMLRMIVGDLGASFGTVASVLGVAVVYTLTIGLLSTLVYRGVGVGGVLLVMIVAVAFNFPSAGGSVPESMLPPFWQGVHSVWVGSGALEAMRSLLYFDGAGAGRWFGQLSLWTAVVVVLLIGLTWLQKRRHAPMTHSEVDRRLTTAAI